MKSEFTAHQLLLSNTKLSLLSCEPFTHHKRKRSSSSPAASLAAKYDKQVLNSRPWVCWNCPARAVGLVHTPASYMHNPEPLIIDIVQPVCANGGACDAAARKMMAEEMNFLST